MVVKRIFLSLAVLVTAVVMTACDEDSSVAGPAGGESSLAAVLAGLGECPSTLLADAGDEQQLVVSVVDSKICFKHENAMFNCCIDSVTVSVVLEGADIVVTETDFCAQPCLCMCPRDVEGEITGLDPGTYSLAVCDTTGSVMCMVEEVTVD